MRRSLVVLVATSLVSCHGAQSHADARTVRIAVHRDPIAFLPMHVAQTLGYYQQEGLSVEISELAGGTKAIEALLGGSVDVAAGSMSDAVALGAEGHPVRGFLLLYTRPTAALAVAPGLVGTIRTVRDLKGRSVGVSTPGSASHQLLNYLLVTNGLGPDDVSAVSVGMAGSSIAALEHQQVDAAVLIASAVTAFADRHDGRGFMADTRTPAGANRVFGSEVFPSVSLLAQDTWLERNADTANRLVRAVKSGLQWVRTQPVERVREMIPEGARMTLGEDLRSIRDAQQAMSTDGQIPAGSMELVARFVAISNPAVRAAHVDLSRTYTNEFALK
jgi:sulfonate transport system substrate-binding protein